MFRRSIVIAAISTLSACSSTPQQSNIGRDPSSQNSACNENPLDLYAPSAKMPMNGGKYDGQCLDTSTKRATHLLASQGDVLRITNVQHARRFWIAEIPLKDVYRAIFHIERFKANIPLTQPAHTQIRFQMLPGKKIQLTGQESDRSHEHAEISNIVFSVEYSAPKGVPYDAMEGFKPNFATVYRFVSIRDRIEDQIKAGQNKVEQIELNVSSSDAAKLLKAAVVESQKAGYSRNYHTRKLNCTTELFKVMAEALPHNKKAKPFKTAIIDPIRGPSLKTLQDMGWVKPGTGNPNLPNLERDIEMPGWQD